jgi:hypothetical protein
MLSATAGDTANFELTSFEQTFLNNMENNRHRFEQTANAIIAEAVMGKIKT